MPRRAERQRLEPLGKKELRTTPSTLLLPPLIWRYQSTAWHAASGQQRSQDMTG